MTDDFYVGYLPESPPGIARFVRRWVLVILGIALFTSLVLAWNQHRPAPSAFEYGVTREYVGLLRERPYPLVVIGDSTGVRTWLLGGEYKHGADHLVQGLDGQLVRLTGSRIMRGGSGMLEVHGPPSATIAPPLEFTAQDLRAVRLTGEIVDSKCWLGAMNPGEGVTHRLCALRCLRGGLPPLVTGTTERGDTVTALLTGPGGIRADSILLGYVAVPVRVTGRLRAIGTLAVLEADLNSIQRVDP